MAKFGKNKPMMDSQRQAFLQRHGNTNPLDNIDLVKSWSSDPDNPATYWGVNSAKVFR